MSDLLPAWPLFSAFLAASAVLAVTPGPGVFYIVSRSLAQGPRHGLASVAGVAVGNLGNALAASAGLAAVFALSSLAFSVVKYAGAGYLVWLGVRMLRAPAVAPGGEAPPPAPVAQVFREGALVALLNPKTALFFAAFLPQFVGSSSTPALAGPLLGTLFVAIAALTDSAYALAAGRAARWLQGPRLRGAGRRFGGGLLVGLGIAAALTGSRGPR